MLIDCDSCVMQHTAACDDCIVAVLLAKPLDGAAAGHAVRRVELDEGEVVALGHLADAGLVAPLRLVVRADGAPGEPAGDVAAG